ncbi:NAD-dependent epimerase/dehydratase family protein [Gammaproteobacteria bacterium]|nr:NAD-dependent epimerase/dehydratase family protein [Gammaproteobacteria bacterium]
MNIALTGSSGLIGSRLLHDLKKMNHTVSCISSSQSSPKDNIYSYEDMDAGNILLPIDCIVHLASINSEMHPSDVALETAITERIVEGMKTMGCKKIIFFSTAKVYGDNSFQNIIFSEGMPLRPSCSYSSAKMLCENIISLPSNITAYNYLIFRMPPVLIDSPKSNLGKLFQVVEKGMPIPSFQVGDLNKRSFLSYKFLAAILNTTLQDDSYFSNEIFNLSDTTPISTNELLRNFASSINKKAFIIYFPNFLFKAMLRIDKLESILCRLFGNFHLSNARLLNKFDTEDID